MRPTRSRRGFPVLIAAASLAAVLVAAACQNSNGVTAPTTVTVTTSGANVTGAWSGTYAPYESRACGSSTASATFTQNGSKVTGIIKTANCGVAGSFKGSVDGDQLTGLIDMAGCVGGGVTGTLAGGELRLAIGDMTKPLITGDTIVMAGGNVSLRR